MNILFIVLICRIESDSISAEATTKYAAKQRSAFLVLHQIEMDGLKKSTSTAMERTYSNTYVIQTPTVERIEKKWIEFDKSATLQHFESNGFTITQIDFFDMYETQKLVRNIDEFVNGVADELKCTPEEYLSTTNYWRLPCKLTDKVHQLLRHEILYELEKRFGVRDIKPTSSFLINMKNVAIDDGWASISKTPYEFRVWTPCFVDDYTTLQLSDRFEISSHSIDNRNHRIINLYAPKIGESLILRHNTKFKLIRPTNTDHFYFVSEWKRNGTHSTNLCDPSNCNLFVSQKKYDKIRGILSLGLEKMRRLYLQYDLVECVDEWIRILDIYDGRSILRPHMLIESYINVPVARKTLRLFWIFLKAKDHHGRNMTEAVFLKDIDDNMVRPIEEYLKRRTVLNLQRFGIGLK